MNAENYEQEEADFQLIITANISGPTFLCHKLMELTDLPLDQEACFEKGDEYARKTHRDIRTYGHASIEVRVAWLHERNLVFDNLLDGLIDNYDAIIACGATEISVLVSVIKSVQGN